MINNWRSWSAILSIPMPLNQPSQSACQRNENHKSIIFFLKSAPTECKDGNVWINWRWDQKQTTKKKKKKKRRTEDLGGLWDRGRGFHCSGRTTHGVCESVNSSQCTGSLHREYTHTHTHTHFAALICCSGGVHRDTHSSPQIQSALGVCVCACVCVCVCASARSTCSNRSVHRGVEHNETEMCTLRSAEVLNGGAEAADRTSTGTFIHMIHVRGAHTHTHTHTHSPIWTLLGKAPIASPQKPENINRNQSPEEILILFRL